MTNENPTSIDTDEDFPPFTPEGVAAILILCTAAMLIVWKWPPAAFTIALTPVFGGPVGVGLYFGLFWLVRELIKKIFGLFRA